MNEKIEKALECFKKEGIRKAQLIYFSTRYAKLKTDNAEIYNNLGLCYANIGDEEKAEKNYLRSIELNPQIPQSYINLG